MSAGLDPFSAYDASEDARSWDAAATKPGNGSSSVADLARFAAGGAPALRWVPMHRSAGKTWIAQALVRRPPDESPLQPSRYLIDGRMVGQNLDDAERGCLEEVVAYLEAEPPPDAGPGPIRPSAHGSKDAPLLVFDEPECFMTPPGDGITDTDRLAGRGFVTRVERLVAAGWRVLILLSPAGWSACAEHVMDPDGDRIVALGGFTATEQQTLFAAAFAAHGEESPLERGREQSDTLWGDWTERPLLARAVVSGLQRRDALSAASAQDAFIAKEPPHCLDEDKLDLLARRLVDNGLTTAQRRILLGGESRTGVSTSPQHTDRLLEEARRHPVLRRRLVSQPLTVHIVSDIHAAGDRFGADDASPAPDAPLALYLNHLDRRAATGDAPSVVIVAGDLVETGGDDTQMTQALSFLGNVVTRLRTHPAVGCCDPNLVVVPGNHDIPWTSGPIGDDGLVEERDTNARHRWFVDRIKQAREDNTNLRRIAVVDQPATTVRFERCGVEIVGVRTTDAAPLVAPGVLEKCRQLVDQLRRGTPEPPDTLHDLLTMWERLDPSCVADDAIRTVERTVDRGVRIVAGHHPVTPMDETNDRPYSMMWNAGPFKRAMVEGGAVLYVHGHAHQGWLSSERRCGTAGGSSSTLRVASAPTLGGGVGNSLRGYVEVTVRYQGSCLTGPIVSVCLWSLNGTAFEAGRTVWFRPGEPFEYPTIDALLDADASKWHPPG